MSTILFAIGCVLVFCGMCVWGCLSYWDGVEGISRAELVMAGIALGLGCCAMLLFSYSYGIS